MKNKTNGKLYRSDNEFGTSFFYERSKNDWWIWVPITLHTDTGVMLPFWMRVQAPLVKKDTLKQASKLEFLLLTGYAFTESAEWIE